MSQAISAPPTDARGPSEEPDGSDGSEAFASATPDTKERLLDAAETLFAERGFEGTSMRAVTQAAQTSVSAANYHFGSKEALLFATLRRRVEPVNRRRLARLAEAEAAAGVEGPGLEAILDAFIRPLFELRAAAGAVGDGRAAHYRHVAARLYADPPERVAALRQELFGEVLEHYQAALARALPGVAPTAVELLLQLSVGVLVHVLNGQLDRRLVEGPPAGEGAPYEATLRTLVAFSAAGMREAARLHPATEEGAR